ncbi:flagellar hook assembly protein FlgD [Noviherbaspirillum suwonense]|uniref:Basal-body rod modification protein FlgD n=1 Tax=Noviherbaspirillum suwonense TaxID=1224511 RepID=A0ABY1QNR7_9BURK|nr:flagellar hook capping FlgD N-terminal domain-containing protein [Noviherbaspirillum suwonense]SMP74760.1 flagellar basal-body rod modification protein FlgD [Noviherbaspirillum suwonense]
MAIESIGGLAAPSAPAAQASSLGLEDFLKVLLTQLTYQDPLKPLDNQEFIAQLAQFTSLEQSRQVNDRLQLLLTIQSATQSVGLLGRTVEVQSATGGPTTTGEVTALRFQQGEPRVTIKAGNGGILTDLPLSQVMLVR